MILLPFGLKRPLILPHEIYQSPGVSFAESCVAQYFEAREIDLQFTTVTHDVTMRIAMIVAVYLKSAAQSPDYCTHIYPNIYEIYMLIWALQSTQDRIVDIRRMLAGEQTLYLSGWRMSRKQGDTRT
jgi:hypothetical protein